ncbi:MAG: hypothetical protein WCK13_05225 [Ignavibacteriota bacterium]
METIYRDNVIYQLTIEDLQNVSNKELDRDLTEVEIKLLEEKIGDFIDWYEIIRNTIIQNISK